MNIGHNGPSGYHDAQVEARLLALMGGGTHVPNCYLNFEIASSALTVSLVAATGHAPSPSMPVLAPFHDTTAATGKPVIRRIAQRTRLVIPSTATMAFTNATAGRLWFVLFDDTSIQPAVQRLGVINCLGSGPSVYPLAAWPIASSTATPASAAQTFYTDVAVASMSYVVLGYATWESGVSTAGTWDALPTRVRMYGPGQPLPGHRYPSALSVDGAVATGTTTIPLDDTVPTGAEGIQVLSKAYTPTSAANVLVIDSQVHATNGSTAQLAMTLFRDNAGVGTAALVTATFTQPADTMGMGRLEWSMPSPGSASTTFTIRIGGLAGGTTTFNGSATARKFGGNFGSFLRIAEIMA